MVASVPGPRPLDSDSRAAICALRLVVAMFLPVSVLGLGVADERHCVALSYLPPQTRVGVPFISLTLNLFHDFLCFILFIFFFFSFIVECDF